MELESRWSLSEEERATLAVALDALLPPEPEGTFPAPSETGMIDDFILARVPEAADERGWTPFPGITADGLRQTLAALAQLERDLETMTDALLAFEQAEPAAFRALWQLAVYGYYSRPETIAAISRDLSPAYHGAPLPLGYAHAIAPWDGNDPLQLPRKPRGAYLPTNLVQRVDLSQLPAEWRGECPLPSPPTALGPHPRAHLPTSW
jgi:hypothetical protein